MTVLGVSACTPEAGRETASFCINGRVLVDAGWHAVGRLLSCGLDPLAIEAVFVTHCHQDHYIGLVELLFYQGLQGGIQGRELELAVYGPGRDIRRVVSDARRLLQVDRYPELDYAVYANGIVPGCGFEACGLKVQTAEAIHPVPALHYRVAAHSGASVTFSGDTAHSTALAELARGTDLLIHEASHGPESALDDPQAGHSGAPDAAAIAAMAGAKLLWLVHRPMNCEEDCLEAARRVFVHTELPSEGDVIHLPIV